ncbi:hypothetical protein [Sphingomonas parapaucimobilis]|uniref:hypothetical protein n=1 Tax=Sphingomonas parapaucimobilis TaxID=28213 RepID=UPI00321B88D5
MTPAPLAETLQIGAFVFAGGFAMQAIVGSLAPNWHRIITILFPVTSAASADQAGSMLRTDEAGAQPMIEVQ